MSNPPNIKRVFRLGIFIFTDIRTGAGTERVAMSIIESAGRDFEIYLIQTDFLDGTRLTSQEYETLSKKCNIVSLQGFNFEHLTKRMNFLNGLIIPIANIFLRFRNRKILKKIDDLDAIYLTSNWFSGLFHLKSGILVGSSHTDFGFSELSKVSVLKAKLVNAGLLYRRISAFHTFPGMESMINFLSNKEVKVFPPLGIDTEKFYPRPSSDVIRMLFVARMEECKGPLIAIESFIKLKLSTKIKVEMNIVGEGTLKERIKKEYANDVIFHDAMDENELSLMYGRSDIFLAPTTCDTFSIVVLEAFASGLYVLISSHLKGRFDDFVQLGYGEYVDPNPISMHIAMENAIANIESIRSKKEKIATYVKNNYDVKIVNENIMNWIRDLRNKKDR